MQSDTIDEYTASHKYSRAQKKKLIAWRNKAVKLIDQLNEDNISLSSLQLLAFTGIPNVNSKDPASLLSPLPMRE